MTSENSLVLSTLSQGSKLCPLPQRPHPVVFAYLQVYPGAISNTRQGRIWYKVVPFCSDIWRNGGQLEWFIEAGRVVPIGWPMAGPMGPSNGLGVLGLTGPGVVEPA